MALHSKDPSKDEHIELDAPPSPPTSVSVASPRLVNRRSRAPTNMSPSPTNLSSPTTTTSTASATTNQLVSSSSTSKRKRSRVTPEQLTYLERAFAMDKSPGAAKRKEISEYLGMQERQTQAHLRRPASCAHLALKRHSAGIRTGPLVFSSYLNAPNSPPRPLRRAKEKMLQSRRTGGARGFSTASPLTPPELGLASEADLQNMIHAGEPTTGANDLIAYTAERSQVLTWYVHSQGFGFRMDVPFSTIQSVDLSLTGVSPGSAFATIRLSRAPNFYMEADTEHGRIWKRCTDWTEGMQASTMLCHEVMGSAAQLYKALSRFPGNRSPAPSPPPGAVVLRAPHAYQAGPYTSPTYSDPPTSSSQPSPMHPHSPMELTNSPQAMSATQFGFAPQPHRDSPPYHGRQRSYSGPAAYHNDVVEVVGSPTGYPASPYSPYPAAESPSLEYTHPQASNTPTAQYADPTYSGYPMQTMTTTSVASPTVPHHQQSASLSEFTGVPIAQITRPFSSHGVPQPQLGTPPHTGMYIPQPQEATHSAEMMSMTPGAMAPGAMAVGAMQGTGLVGSYGSFGEGGGALLHRVGEHHTPPPPLAHRTSSSERGSLSGALGDYSSNRSPHSGSEYHHSS
ncbi:hypothetical protein FRB99_007256 [Tulasnella sp. 403]|nr:hypothetical protein FRB99_007256 [Tulasnella sp. 403]